MAEHYLNGARWSLKNDHFSFDGKLNQDGKADLKNIPLGEYTFTLSKTGYYQKSQKVIVDGAPINIEVNLDPLPAPPKPKKQNKKQNKKSSKSKKSSEESKPKKADSKKDEDKKDEDKTEEKEQK